MIFNTRYTAALLAGVITLTLGACGGERDAETTLETGVIIRAADAEPTAAVSAAFFEAQGTAAYFSGYGRGMYAQGDIDVASAADDDTSVRYTRFAVCDTMDELRELTQAVFTYELADEFLGMTVGSEPLFLESDGILYRFGGYVSQYTAEARLTEILECTENADGTVTLSVRAVFPSLYGDGEEVTVEYDYTCVKDGDKYRFTGEFPLLTELAAKKIFAE